MDLDDSPTQTQRLPWQVLRVAVPTLMLVLAACGSPTDTGDPGPSTTVPMPTTSVNGTDTTCSTVAEDACGLEDDPLADPTGTVSVTLGAESLEFEATRCLLAVDVFVIDGVSADGSVTLSIRHASPPTRPDPQPSMSYLLIEPEPAFESPPAAVSFDGYDPAAGTATGFVDDTTSFSVRCER